MRRILGAAVMAASLAGVPSVALAAEGADCFLCDEYEHASGGWVHYDVILFFNDMHGGGGQHPGGSFGQCAAAHMTYVTALAALPDAVMRPTATDHRVAALTRVLLENDDAQLNADRSALQIVASDHGAVIVHLPLSHGELTELQLVSERAATGQAAETTGAGAREYRTSSVLVDAGLRETRARTREYVRRPEE